MTNAAWNRDGRAANLRVCEAFDSIIDDGGSSDADLAADKRPAKLADAVLREVVECNARGCWREARERFDPAHAPFLAHMKKTRLGLSAVAILGEASLLVRRGDAYAAGPVLHLDGDAATELPGVLGFGISRSRRWLALATADGLTVAAGLRGARSRTVAWPTRAPVRPHSLEVSDDGGTVVIASDAAGVWLARGDRWHRVFPRDGITARSKADDGLPDAVHAALSPDGTRVAFGWQDAPGHYVDRVDDAGPVRAGIVGTVSDTPYHVRFTDDSRRLLSNTRYMQSGVTVCVDVDRLAGTEEYDELPEGTPHTDDYLRAYGLAIVPGGDQPVAWIGGAGWLHAAPLGGGKPVFTQLFGSTLNAIDHDPIGGLVAIASGSGMLHVVDPSAAAEPGRERGYRPRRELYRWIFWDTLPAPIRW